MKSPAAALAVLVAAVLAAKENGAASPAKAVTAEEVQALLSRLDADEPARRDAAAEELVALGPAALSHLPTLESESLSAEQRRRLRAILSKLRQAKAESDVAGSKVRLRKETRPYREVLEAIRQQTGMTVIDLRATFGQGAPPETVEFEAADTFWRTLDRLAERTGAMLQFDTGERAVGLVAAQGARRPVAYSGAFRYAVDRIVLSRNFAEKPPEDFRIAISLQFEPKLRPVLIEFDTLAFTAIDDRDRTLRCLGDAVVPMPVDPASYALPLVLRFEPPARGAERLARLEGKLNVWLPAHTERLEFQGSKPGRREQGGVSVELREVSDEDGIWSYPIVVERPPDQAEADSYLRAALENELSLVGPDGKRWPQNGGMSTFDVQQGEGREYLFVDVPGKPSDYRLEIVVPAGLTRVLVPLEFKNLPLP